jgi:GT2 family glycosyltransferase
MPKVYILLPVHNRREITRGFVECLAAQTFTDYHLILIDDGSTDGTAEMVQARIASTTVLRGDGDWWWAGSLQQGLNWLKQGGTDDRVVVLFINDDVHFAPDYLERAVGLMSGKNRTLVLSRFKKPETGEVMETGVTANWRRLNFTVADSAMSINCLSTRGLFAHWEDVRVIGGFYPRLLPHYLSDYEYTIRAYRKGFKCETSADLLIEPNTEATDYRAIPEASFVVFWRKYCSKKSAANPLYWSSFILLASEPVWLLPNLLRVWARAVKTVRKALIATRTLTSCHY